MHLPPQTKEFGHAAALCLVPKVPLHGPSSPAGRAFHQSPTEHQTNADDENFNLCTLCFESFGFAMS
eukprot:754078-Amphidinium_carterae.2